MARKRTIFVSYSHRDGEWLERLRTALAPLTSSHRLDPWDDTRIKPGAGWRKEIDGALATANVAVLLVTQAFFASEFIMNKELPVILRRWKRDGLPVVWIPVSFTNYKRTPLRDIQAVVPPSLPLDAMRVSRRNKAFVDIAEAISASAAISGVGDVLRITDEATPAIMFLATGKRQRRRLGTTAVKRDGRVEVHSLEEGRVEVIDPPDLGRLSEPERQLVATYQASMASAFTKWKDLYGRRDELTQPEAAAFRRAHRRMCEDLSKTIDFLDRVGKHLPDHYRTVRFECGEVLRRRRSPSRA